LIRALVTSNPSPAYVKRVADVFANNGGGVRGDLAATARAVLLDPEARQDAPTATQGHLKDPILHSLGLIRVLGGTVIDPSNLVDATLLQGRMSATGRAAITTALAASTDTKQNAITALYLSAISAEFGVHK